MNSCVLRLTPLVLVLTLLSACATANSSAGLVCPPLREYSREFQKRLADEVVQAPVDAAYPIALQDYAALREQVRVCDKD